MRTRKKTSSCHCGRFSAMSSATAGTGMNFVASGSSPST
jgi:hypothetical protein